MGVATVTVLKFSNPDAAADALRTVNSLEDQHLITLIDAALISWPSGRKSPTTKRLLTPLLAMAIEEGTSALFLITADAVLDRVADAMSAMKFEIFATSLSEAQEKTLRAAFAENKMSRAPGPA
jgi:uncharacterized membrane protein